MRMVYARHADMTTRVAQEFPELRHEVRVGLLASMRASAHTSGLDVTKETNLTWMPVVYYRYEGEGSDAEFVECPEEESKFTRFTVEATYEEIE